MHLKLWPALMVLVASVCSGQAPDLHGGAPALRRQDQRLDAAYRRLRDQLRAQPQAQARARNEQRAWLRHRDFVCSGTRGPDQTACLIRETAAQANKIEERLHAR